MNEKLVIKKGELFTEITNPLDESEKLEISHTKLKQLHLSGKFDQAKKDRQDSEQAAQSEFSKATRDAWREYEDAWRPLREKWEKFGRPYFEEMMRKTVQAQSKYFEDVNFIMQENP